MADALPLIAIISALVGGSIIVFLLSRFVRRRNLEQLTTTLSAEASARGWTMASESRDELQSFQWRGSTDGIAWMAESLSGWRGVYDPDSAGPRNRRRVSMTRWQTSGLRGSTGAIVLMGMTNHPEMPASWPSGGGPVADLLTKAILSTLGKAIDEQFAPEIGSAVDATRLQRVDSAERQIPGYIVLAENPADATRVLDAGVGRALSATVAAATSTPAPEGFFLVICKQGVGLALPDAVTSLAELDPIIRRGIAIATAVKW